MVSGAKKKKLTRVVLMLWLIGVCNSMKGKIKTGILLIIHKTFSSVNVYSGFLKCTFNIKGNAR